MVASVVDEVFRRHARAVATGMQGSSGIHKSRLEPRRERVEYRGPSHAQAAAQRQMEKASYALAQILMCDERIKTLSLQDPSIPQHSLQMIDYGSPEIEAFQNEMDRLHAKRHEYIAQLRALYGDDSGPDFDLRVATRAVQMARDIANLQMAPPAAPPPPGTWVES